MKWGINTLGYVSRIVPEITYKLPPIYPSAAWSLDFFPFRFLYLFLRKEDVSIPATQTADTNVARAASYPAG